MLNARQQKTLQQLGIGNGSVLTVTVVTYGGTKPPNLAGHVTWTNRRPCSILHIGGEDEYRAVMKCGCVVSVESMIAILTSTLNEGKYRFLCPICSKSRDKINNSEWEYAAVRHVVGTQLGANELLAHEKKLNENFASGRVCPECRIICTKNQQPASRSLSYVVCGACMIHGRQTAFCWFCGDRWVADKNAALCGNAACPAANVSSTIAYLGKCPTIKIGDCSDCPETRACPRCNFLITHGGHCKHMECPGCNYEFCFVCLTPKKQFESWQCAAYELKCAAAAAPRQTKLVGDDGIRDAMRRRPGSGRPLQPFLAVPPSPPPPQPPPPPRPQESSNVCSIM